MLKSRWSTFTVLCFSTLVAMLGFYVGKDERVSIHERPAISAEAGSSAPAQPLAVASAVVVSQRENSDVLVESVAEVVRKLMAEPPTPARNEALVAALEKLASQNPRAALALAESETNPQFRKQLLDATFTGWGKVDPTSAANWILAQPEGSLDNSEAISAVLKGAVQQSPDAAIALTKHLNETNPGQARDYGDALIYALGQNGGFQRAADFAVAGSGDLRTEWLAAAYGNWGNYQPEDAAAYAMQLSDSDTRAAAVDAVIPDWAQINPKNLADFAMNNLTDNDQKTRALTDALVYWAGNNATEAANWINQAGPSPALDQGEAAIATQQDVMKQPDVALSWAESITDENLRSRTITAVVQTWALTDHASALDYVQRSQNLQDGDRASLLASLNTAPAGQ